MRDALFPTPRPLLDLPEDIGVRSTLKGTTAPTATSDLLVEFDPTPSRSIGMARV